MSHSHLPSPLSSPIAAGALSITAALATLIVPPVVMGVIRAMDFRLVGLVLALASLCMLVVLSLLGAHRAWWCWTSGRHEQGFYSALAAMLVAHTTFAFWVIWLCPTVGGLNGASVGSIVVLIFLAGSALFLHSAAAKYFVVGSMVITAFMGILTCKVIEQRELARSNSVHNNLHQVGLEISGQTSRHLPIDERTAAATSGGDTSLEERILRIKEIVAREFLPIQNRRHTE